MRVVVVGVLALCLVGQTHGVGSEHAQVLAGHKGGIHPNLGERSAFGVNGTRLRWADFDRGWTLDISASSSFVTGRWPAGLAFSQGRGARRAEGGGNNRYNMIQVWRPGFRRGLPLQLEDFPTPDEGPGGYPTDPFALGPYLAYGWHETGRAVRGTCDAEGFGCQYAVERGGIRLIEGLRGGRLVTDKPVAALTISSTGTIAYVPATTRWHNWNRNGRVESAVEVITLWSPQVLQRIRVPGKIVDLAVTDRLLAVRTQRKTHWAVVFYDLWSGTKLRMIRRTQEFGSWLGLRGATAVILVGSNLVELNAYTGAKRLLRRIRADEPGGISFAGDKLVWFENYGASYRVMSMSLDRRQSLDPLTDGRLSTAS